MVSFGGAHGDLQSGRGIGPVFNARRVELVRSGGPWRHCRRNALARLEAVADERSSTDNLSLTRR
jgi:hypothetical protein